jgi:uncharacterized protein YbbC (DUF1343 family)
MNCKRSLTTLLLCLAAACTQDASVTSDSARVFTGADQLLEEPFKRLVAGKKLGLVTSQTGVNRRLESTVEMLSASTDTQLVALFAPEHGIDGDLQAGESVQQSQRIYSLYGKTLSPTDEMLEGLEVLVFDIQDVGSRFYTFQATMLKSMRAAAKKGISFIVLDRPVPINGIAIEGPVLEHGFESFVGIHTIPNRHGMTLGELAGMFNAELNLGLNLHVVPLVNWTRSSWFDETGLIWIQPSPNMPTLETANVYPGFCLVEGTNLSEGRGTTRPFQLIGAPWLDHRTLAENLNALKLPSVYFRPQHFVPTFSKHAGESCLGIEVHVQDRDRFRPVSAAIHFLVQARKLHPTEFQFNQGFDRLAGNSWVRENILEGKSARQIIDAWQPALEEFRERRARYLLY